MINDLTANILKVCSDNKIEIISPLIIEDGGRIGSGEADYQLNIMSELKSNKYFFNRGVAGGFYNTNDGPTKDDAITYLCKDLVELFKNSKLQFVNLVLPKRAVDVFGFSIINGIWIRYLIDNIPSTDSLWERWDILVKKVN